MIKLIKTVLLSSFIFYNTVAIAEEISSFTSQAPLYISSDINGDLNKLKTHLKTIRLIDIAGNWIGEDAHFISLGDILHTDNDKQPSARKIIDLLIKLQIQAEEKGGKVHVLMGEKELHQLQGNWGTLTAKRIEQFSDIYPDKDGINGYQQAFSLTAKYGQWLAELPFVIKVNDQLFTHAGISKWIKNTALDELNKKLRSELISNINTWTALTRSSKLAYNTPISDRLTIVSEIPDSPNKTLYLSSLKSLAITRMGPMRYHGNEICHPYFEKDLLSAKLKYWKTSRLWVGHAIGSDKKAHKHLNDQLMLIDASNINTEGHSWVSKVTASGKTSFIDGITGKNTQPEKISHRISNNIYNMNDDELENFLATATITHKENTKEGRTKPLKVTLERDGKILHGIFKYRDSIPFAHRGVWNRKKNTADRYQYEVVAYKLDRLLGIGLVPVTVFRKVNGRSGIIQLWIEGLVSQLQFNQQKMDFTGYCDPRDQTNMMNAFDYLILNTDRNQTNILYRRNDWQVLFIDHSKSFGTSKRRPEILKDYEIKASPTFKNALRSLNSDNLSELRPWLHKRQIRALLMRRDKIVEDNF
ncbi:MAG: hypothetical protein ACI9N9_000226 [Enterobacterales bacterium]